MKLLSSQSKNAIPLLKEILLSKVLNPFFIWSFGISFFVWAFLDPRFRDNEGFIERGFCLPVSVGTALLILGGTINGRLRKTAFWFALALVGQAVQLQMIDAGRFVRYQHYRHVGGIIETDPLLLIYIILQTVLVVIGFRNRWKEIRAWINRNFKIWQLIAVSLLFFLSSATVSRDKIFYIAELLFSGFIQAVNLANIVLMLWTIPNDMLASLNLGFKKLFGFQRNDAEPGGIDRYAILAALWVIVFATLLTLFPYQRHPHLSDEAVYLYHAKYLAAGMLTMPLPPVLDGFNLDLMNYEDTRWFSPVPPGWPAMLAIGVLFGIPWVINPVLAGINILLAYTLLREVYDRYTARVAVLLLCVSPWYIFMAMNFMTHTFALTCALIAGVAVARARRTGSKVWSWIGGIAAGMIGLIRPLEGFVMTILFGLWVMKARGQRFRFSPVSAFVIGFAIVGAVILWYNSLLTGDPMKFPIEAYTDKYYGPGKNSLGFGPDKGLGWAIAPYPGHSLLGAAINANLNITSVNTELFGWGTGSLFLIGIMLFSGILRKSDYLMLTVIGAIVGIHTFYWFSGGPDFGARYWFLIIVPCVVLTIRGMQFLTARLETDQTDAGKGVRVMVGVLSLCLLAIMNFFPWRAIDKYYHYLGMRPDIHRLSEEYKFGKSIVLIRGERFPDYASAAIFNPIDLHADLPVYAWDMNPDVRDRILNAYPDRPVWLVDGPSVTKGAFKVVGGPLSANDLLTNNKEIANLSVD